MFSSLMQLGQVTRGEGRVESYAVLDADSKTLVPGDFVMLVKPVEGAIHPTVTVTTAATDTIMGVIGMGTAHRGWISVVTDGYVFANPLTSLYTKLEVGACVDTTAGVKCCHPLVMNKIQYDKADGTQGDGYEVKL